MLAYLLINKGLLLQKWPILVAFYTSIHKFSIHQAIHCFCATATITTVWSRFTVNDQSNTIPTAKTKLSWLLMKTNCSPLQLENCPWSRIEVRPTTWPWHTTFTINLIAKVMIHTHTKTHVQRSTGSKDRVETNGRTDGRYRLLYLPG